MVKWVDQMFKLNAHKTKLTLPSACWFSTGKLNSEVNEFER